MEVGERPTLGDAQQSLETVASWLSLLHILPVLNTLDSNTVLCREVNRARELEERSTLQLVLRSAGQPFHEADQRHVD